MFTEKKVFDTEILEEGDVLLIKERRSPFAQFKAYLIVGASPMVLELREARTAVREFFIDELDDDIEIIHIKPNMYDISD